LKASALNAQGQRLAELAVAAANGQASLSVATNAGTLWYELLIAKDTPFDRWRFANFTAQELANPSFSGELGLPAHDGVPNLLKYASGLLPKLPASSPLIAGELRTLAGRQHLVMTFTRAKAATDLLVVPEVSGDLSDWHSGPDYTEEIEILDQGATERVAVRDRLPFDQAQERFMRLNVSLKN
jgi:alpha-L-arabinofuranosidase